MFDKNVDTPKAREEKQLEIVRHRLHRIIQVLLQASILWQNPRQCRVSCRTQEGKHSNHYFVHPREISAATYLMLGRFKFVDNQLAPCVHLTACPVLFCPTLVRQTAGYCSGRGSREANLCSGRRNGHDKRVNISRWTTRTWVWRLWGNDRTRIARSRWI